MLEILSWIWYCWASKQHEETEDLILQRVHDPNTDIPIDLSKFWFRLNVRNSIEDNRKIQTWIRWIIHSVSILVIYCNSTTFRLGKILTSLTSLTNLLQKISPTHFSITETYASQINLTCVSFPNLRTSYL